jgi:hypothetical protein
MTSSHGRLASLAVLACCAVPAAGALAASASAATLAANEPCFVNPDPAVGIPMTITGAGFTPGSSVTLSGGTTFATGTADATGSVSIQAPAPTVGSLGPGAKATALTATDGAGVSASVVVHSANLAVETTPRSVRNVRKDKVTFAFSGFVPGKHIYGYYVRKKVVAKVKFARAKGPCGTLKQKALLFPGGHPNHISYKVTFENTSKYSKKAFPRVTGTLSIFHF